MSNVTMSVVSFGKHRGKSVGTLVVKEPDYVIWAISQACPEGDLADLVEEVYRLIDVFDAKPIVGKCSGPACKRVPTLFTTYRRASTLYRWCDSCEPSRDIGYQGKLNVVRTYMEVASHIERTCNGHPDMLREIIEAMAAAKGLSSRSGEEEIANFFGVDTYE